MEKLTRKALPRAEVPRGEEVFQVEAARAAEGRANQGVPPHRRPGGPGTSRRPEAARQRGGGHGHGHNRGAHTPREATPAEGGPAGPRKATSLGTWKPKRR